MGKYVCEHKRDKVNNQTNKFGKRANLRAYYIESISGKRKKVKLKTEY